MLLFSDLEIEKTCCITYGCGHSAAAVIQIYSQSTILNQIESELWILQGDGFPSQWILLSFSVSSAEWPVDSRQENTFGTASQSICICIPGALYWFKAIQVYITALFQLYYCNPFPTNCMSCCICTWSLPLNATLTLRWCSTNRGLWQLSVVWCIIVLFLKQA